MDLNVSAFLENLKWVSFASTEAHGGTLSEKGVLRMAAIAERWTSLM